MKYVIVLAILMTLAVGCNQNAKDIDQRITVLESSLTSLETKLNDTTTKLDALQSSLDDTAESLSGFQLAVADVQPAQTGFVSGEATSLVIDKIIADLALGDGYGKRFYPSNLSWQEQKKLERSCYTLQKLISTHNPQYSFDEKELSEGVWEVSKAITLPVFGGATSKINPMDFLYTWQVFENSKSVVATHEQWGTPIC